MSDPRDNSTTQTLEVALTALKREKSAFMRRLVLGIGAWVFSIGALCHGLFLLLASKPLGLPFLLLSLLLIVLGTVAMSRSHGKAARALAELQDVRAVGALVGALLFTSGESRRLLTSALVGLLVRLRATDASLLNPAQRAILYDILQYEYLRYGVDLPVAILKAFAQIGDEDALPYVQWLAERNGRTAEERRVHEEARECLPFLQDRVEQLRISQTLLRPAVSLENPSELLRPSSGTQEQAPDTLLRPTER